MLLFWEYLRNIALTLEAVCSQTTATRQAESLDQLTAEHMLEETQLVEAAYALTLEFSKQDCFTYLPFAFPIKLLHWADGDKRL